MGIEQVRLVINRFDRKMFTRLGFYRDLDDVIDASQTQLIALIPFDIGISVIMQKGLTSGKNSPSLKIFDGLADRVLGRQVPLIYK